MYNWNVASPQTQSPIWKLNQTINFGLNGTKLNLHLVKKYWKKLSLDPKRKTFLQYILWGKLS